MRLIEYKFPESKDTPSESGKRFKIVQTEEGEVQIVFVYEAASDVWLRFDRR